MEWAQNDTEKPGSPSRGPVDWPGVPGMGLELGWDSRTTEEKSIAS
jgi:hypothetical protein